MCTVEDDGICGLRGLAALPTPPHMFPSEEVVMSGNRDQQAVEFAAAPQAWRQPQGRLVGAAAAAHGRATLEAAGVDVDAVERRVGRPRIGAGSRSKGERSARVNVAITDTQEAIINQLAREGRTRSDIVREALDQYLAPRA